MFSLPAFGSGGPFGFNTFSDKWKKQKNKKAKPSKKQHHSTQGEGSSSTTHEALGNEWLQYGNCPIAKSYRAINRVLPLVAKATQPSPGAKFRCPPAVVAARAALSKTSFARNLRPQPLETKMLAISALSMAINLPLGVWREHTEKFSPSWFVAVHGAVPLLAMLRKAILMPKGAMALTLGASILGQTIGARAERIWMKKRLVEKSIGSGVLECGSDQRNGIGRKCGKEEMVWVIGSVSQDRPSSPKASSVCF